MTDQEKILLVELELDGTLDEWRDACGNDYFVHIAQEEYDRLCGMGLSEDSAKQLMHEFVMGYCDRYGQEQFTEWEKDPPAWEAAFANQLKELKGPILSLEDLEDLLDLLP
jgi:hypothetical protein